MATIKELEELMDKIYKKMNSMDEFIKSMGLEDAYKEFLHERYGELEIELVLAY